MKRCVPNSLENLEDSLRLKRGRGRGVPVESEVMEVIEVIEVM